MIPTIRIPMAAPGPGWSSQIAEDLKRAESLQPIAGDSLVTTCLFCRTPMMDSKLYHDFVTGLTDHRVLEFPDGRRVPIVSSIRLVVCKECAELTRPSLDPLTQIYPLFRGCRVCNAVIMLTDIYTDGRRLVRRIIYRMGSRGRLEAGESRDVYMCLFCQRAMTQQARSWPYKTPIMPARSDREPKSEYFYRFFFYRRPDATPVTYDPSAVEAPVSHG